MTKQVTTDAKRAVANDKEDGNCIYKMPSAIAVSPHFIGLKNKKNIPAHFRRTAQKKTSIRGG
jgi:hypothetical protein